MSKREPKPKPAATPARPRGGPARAVAELLPEVGGAAFRRYGFVQSAIVTRWPEIVGTRYAHVSAPESLKFPRGQKQDGVLTIICSGAHAPMMQHIAPEIAERVNRFFGYAAVAKVAIRQGDVPRPDAARTAPPSLRPIGPSTTMGQGLRQIADPELRTVLEALAVRVAATSGAPVLGEPE